MDKDPNTKKILLKFLVIIFYIASTGFCVLKSNIQLTGKDHKEISVAFIRDEKDGVMWLQKLEFNLFAIVISIT